MLKFLYLSMIVAMALLVGAGCDRSTDSRNSSSANGDIELLNILARPFIMTADIVPSPLETVEFEGESLTFWPFTADDFSGEGKDPINLIFFGHADPLDIRAALLSLDGDRSSLGMDPVPPFNDVWDDEISGDIQASYGQSEGWNGGCVQLTCGDYGPLRFHLRLFRLGDWTVGNAHFEMQVPGTSNHQVLSWEVAEQFVIGDFMRSGLLDPDLPMMPTQEITPLAWRTIPAILYNELPLGLRELIGGPPDDVTEDVDLLSDGQATILNLAGQVPRIPETRTKDFVIQFGQVVPKPFCSSGPGDYVYVEGPVHMLESTSLSHGGRFHATFRAEGELMVTPVNPETGEPVGETLMAEVIQNHNAHFSNRSQWVSSLISQQLLPGDAEGAGRLMIQFQVRSNGRSGYKAFIRCADGDMVGASPEESAALIR